MYLYIYGLDMRQVYSEVYNYIFYPLLYSFFAEKCYVYTAIFFHLAKNIFFIEAKTIVP